MRFCSATNTRVSSFRVSWRDYRWCDVRRGRRRISVSCALTGVIRCITSYVWLWMVLRDFSLFRLLQIDRANQRIFSFSRLWICTLLISKIRRSSTINNDFLAYTKMCRMLNWQENNKYNVALIKIFNVYSFLSTTQPCRRDENRKVVIHTNRTLSFLFNYINLITQFRD